MTAAKYHSGTIVGAHTWVLHVVVAKAIYRSSRRLILFKSPVYPLDYRFLVPLSDHRLTRAWWLSATGYVAALEPPPGRGGRQWLGSPPGTAPGLVSQKATARSPGRQPFLAHSIPSPSSHGSAMARTGRKSLIPRKALKKDSFFASYAP